ncbi:uncharacterized protein VTP21DRAFT_1084 [Calcarisporiella thermophila]|uniref:uncharacterized protein n=1 Tax=Calcarisporiella thermophila TaxID=911321 RepID=UPI003743B5BF
MVLTRSKYVRQSSLSHTEDLSHDISGTFIEQATASRTPRQSLRKHSDFRPNLVEENEYIDLCEDSPAANKEYRDTEHSPELGDYTPAPSSVTLAEESGPKESTTPIHDDETSHDASNRSAIPINLVATFDNDPVSEAPMNLVAAFSEAEPKAKVSMASTGSRGQDIPLTIPKEFNFATHSRARRSGENILEKRSTGRVKKRKKKKTGAPKRDTGVPTASVNELTVPKPFAFHVDSRAALRDKSAELEASAKENSPFVPMAVRIQQFEEGEQNPSRANPPKKSSEKQELKLTHPQSPRLTTKLQAKTSDTMIKDAQRPILRVLKEVKTNQITHPKSPQLLTKLRKKPQSMLKDTSARSKRFTNKTLNKRLFGTAAVGTRPQMTFQTIPRSPAITKSKPRQIPSPPPRPVFHANPMPKFHPPAPVRNEPKATVVEPFRFVGEAISARQRQEIQEKIRREAEEAEARRRFKANPMPNFVAPQKAPPPVQFPITEPTPFNLLTDLRGERYQKRFQERLALWKHREREQMRFHARPIPVSHDCPFIPKVSDAPLTEANPIHLHLEDRMQNRRAFDAEIRRREEEAERERERKRKEDEEREKEEIKRLRRKLVHKAQPIRYWRRDEHHNEARADVGV